jgi:tRNA dimethylallyltransferase
VPHFGIDLVEPGERFTVADFKEYATAKIEEIRAREHVPIVAGGTGLYVDALVFDYKFDGLSKDTKHGTPEGNESAGEYKDRAQMSKDFIVFGISWEPDELRERIALRMRGMYSEKLYEETRFLVEKYGWDSQAMKSNVYQFVDKYLKGEITLEEAIEQSIYDDWHLAKRQITWFKRNPEIKWFKRDEIEQEIFKIFTRV